jgi:hypothetical protein
VISVALIIAIFNSEFSWLHNFALKTDFPGTKIQEEIQKDLLKNWIESGRMKISVLGVDLGGSDATILGSLGLFILTTWFFYCIRRENHLIGNLLIDANENHDNDLMLAVYHGITSYTVFTVIGKDDEPISKLQRSQPREHPVAYLRFTFKALIFLPVITIGFMMLVDLISLLEPAVVRDLEKPLYKALEAREIIHLVIIELVAAFVGGVIINICNDILRFERATGELLRQFNELLFPQRPTAQPAAHP